MGLYRTLECIEYDNDKPILNVSVFNSRLGWVKLKLYIDTGYSGYILLPNKVYNEIHEIELPKSEFPIYKTIIGEISMRRSFILIKIFNLEFEGFIETPLYGGGKYLAGRKLLNMIRLAFLGPENKLCNLSEK